MTGALPRAMKTKESEIELWRDRMDRSEIRREPALAHGALESFLRTEFPQVFKAGRGLSIEEIWHGGAQVRSRTSKIRGLSASAVATHAPAMPAPSRLCDGATPLHKLFHPPGRMRPKARLASCICLNAHIACRTAPLGRAPPKPRHSPPPQGGMGRASAYGMK